MNKQTKIGIGITTKDRPEFLNSLLASLSDLTGDAYSTVIVNDGKPLLDFNSKIPMIQNSSNLGISKTKNKAFEFLLNLDCDYIFMLEDDVLVKDVNVFEKYIKAYETTKIQHFNYGPGTPFNRAQSVQFDIHNRSELSQDSKPNPRLVIEYSNEVAVDLYLHVAGMFSFFTKDILHKVGLFDERFFNAWEHVDHTYRIIKENAHPPFWWFADIHESWKYLGEQKNALSESTISSSDGWLVNVNKGREIYMKKHGHYPNNPPTHSQEQVIKSLKDIKRYE